MLLIRLVLCAILCPAALSSSNVHTVLPENYDSKPYDGDEHRVRNYVSDHEIPKDVPTRVKIVGDLGTPPPSVKLDFVPKQTYVQVRRYDTVKRLPQEAAMEEAATSEEVANAPRLREVVTHKKTQEVYEEQGYEDAAYDHGGSKKHKIEEEVKDNQSIEFLGPNNNSSLYPEETKDNIASIAPSGRGTWSRFKTTTGKKTRFEEDGDKRKVITNDSNPISEKSSGNYTKFDGGKMIVVQNFTETEKRDIKKEGAESRRISSFSKTRDKVEPTTYRPIMRHDYTRNTEKPIKNEQKTNRTRSRPRKRQETDVQKPQTNYEKNTPTDVIASYDNSPWIPISPPTDYKNPHAEIKKPVKSKMNSELYEQNGHATKYGYTINHDTPYQYVFPTDLLTPESTNKPHRKLKPKPQNPDVIDGNPKGSHYSNYEFIPQTNYDGSAIIPKQKKVKSHGENFSFDSMNLPSNNKHRESTTQFKTDFNHNTKQDATGAANQRQKNKPVQSGSIENSNNNFKPEPYREQKKKSHRDMEIGLGNHGNSGSRFTSSITQDLSPPKSYDAPFITRLKKNNYNVDSRGDPSLRIYPKYEIYPSFQNIKHTINDDTHYGQRPPSNINKGHANMEFNENPPRNIKHENTRLSEYSKFNSRPKNINKPAESIENWDNYPKIRGQTAKPVDENFPKFNKAEGYPKFETNKRPDSTSTKSSSIYRLIPYEKSVKMNNPYSYVYHDDHYPSGSRYNGVKVEVTTQSSKLNNRSVYWNNRHPHLPKDSIKNVPDVQNVRDKSEDENARHVENLTLAHFSGLHKPGSYRPLPLEYNERVNNLAKLLNDNYPRRTRRDLEVINIASSGTTTEIPVDTVVYPHYKNAPKESAIRYATNPNLTPRKTAGGMEFYASTDSVKCNDMSVPTDIVPERTDDGEWVGEPSNNTVRVNALGDKIGCFKTKYFGSDPLDNPIFKEKDVGIPQVLFSVKKPPKIIKPEIKAGKPHVDWDFADELIPGNWFPNKDKRSRRSENRTLPTNHKTEGLESIIPEPVILTFPTKATVVVYTNQTKKYDDENDSEVSSNDEHVLKYTIHHPTPKPESNIRNKHSTDNKIVGLVPPPQTTKKLKKYQKLKKPPVKKVFKKVKTEEETNEPDLLDVLSPITSFFIDDDDVMAAPIVHNFFNIKMTPAAKLKTSTKTDNGNSERVNIFQVQNYRRTKRNMKGVDLQKPKQRKLHISDNSNVSLSSPTARVRMYTPKNGSWFRDKRDHISVNVDERRKEPRYYYHTERPRVRVKRVVYNPPFHSRSSQVFSSKYLVSDQEKSETLPEEINVAFSTTPRYQTTPKFIPAIAFGDSKTKIINYNDSVANSTNEVQRSELDKKGSLIYVINPDTGLGKWMQVIKVKNEEDTKTALSNGPVYLEKKVKDGVAEESIGKFGFKGGSTKELFKNVFGPTIDHRFKIKHPTREPIKGEPSEQPPKKPDCPKISRPRKKEMRRRTTTTTTTTTTEIPVEEEVDERPEEQLEEQPEEQSAEYENNPNPPLEDGEGGEIEEEQTERPRYHQESEENPYNVEDEDQDVHESKRKKPYSKIKKPEFSGYYFGSRDRNKKIM